MANTYQIRGIGVELCFSKDIELLQSDDKTFLEDLKKVVAGVIFKDSIGAVIGKNNGCVTAVTIFDNATRRKEHYEKSMSEKHENVKFLQIRSDNINTFFEMMEAQKGKHMNNTENKVSVPEETTTVVEMNEEPEVASAAEMYTETGMMLPEITSEDKKVVLAQTEGYDINMMVLVDTANQQVKGCKLYLSDSLSGKGFINGDNEVSLEKGKIINATDHTIMNCLHRFNVNVSEDTKKLAFERAKSFLEISTKRVEVPSSECIEDVLAELERVAIHNARLEEANKELTVEQRKFKYDPEGGTIAIRDNHFQTLLDELGTGYTKIKFCKKVRMLEGHRGEDIIVLNRSGYGYGFNETGNLRYYKFKILEEVA